MVGIVFWSLFSLFYSHHSDILTGTPCIEVPETNAISLAYQSCGLDGLLSFEAFEKTLDYVQRYAPTNPIVAICDFTKPSSEKRFFLVDLENKKLLISSLVAHGRNSGTLVANSFSNRIQSLQTSLGAYLVLNKIISPKHGRALLLDGLDKGLNDNARQREIIMHAADYVSEDYIKKYGRLGRSFGCPALPQDIMDQCLDKLNEGSILYIYAKP